VNRVTKSRKKSKRKYQRSEKRVRALLPVLIGKAHQGLTRDVSASGAFFETDASYRVGSVVRFAINLETPWGPARFDYRGKIVRLERHDGTLGVAVRFTDDKDQPQAAPRPRRGR
jgi:hypothetical protein